MSFPSLWESTQSADKSLRAQSLNLYADDLFSDFGYLCFVHDLYRVVIALRAYFWIECVPLTGVGNQSVCLST